MEPVADNSSNHLENDEICGAHDLFARTKPDIDFHLATETLVDRSLETPEEIAWRHGLIKRTRFARIAKLQKNSNYGRYLLRLFD